jgi:transposase InsO family protein
VVVTATFRLLYVFIVMEHGSRRLLDWNVTRYPTAEWTLRQLREGIPADHAYRFVIHDRDGIYSEELDRSIANLGLMVLKTPYKSPQANSLCERLIGSLRRECLDYLIAVTEEHLRQILKTWATYYNHGRPHAGLGPGVPDPPSDVPAPLQRHRHRIGEHLSVIARPVLGGLHHEYGLALRAA